MTEQTFQKQVAKEGAQTADAQFMSLLEQPKTGVKDGKPWKKSKVSFQIEGKSQPNKFVFWNQKEDSKSQYKTIEELKQFTTYRIVWYEKEENYNNQDWVSKTIQIIKDHNANDTLVQPQAPAAPQTADTPPIDWVNFQKDYNEKYKEEPKRCNVHMLGTYIFNKHKENFASVIALCNKNFKK